MNAKAALDENSFTALLDIIHSLGRDLVRPAAVEVDRDARFPHEAFTEFKKHKLLSAYVPVVYGGMGLSITQICKICEILGGYCASTAMIFAMHQIQVACIVHHCESSPFFQNFLRELVSEQYLLDLERHYFIELIQMPKTLQRIEHTLKTGKPLRN